LAATITVGLPEMLAESLELELPLQATRVIATTNNPTSFPKKPLCALPLMCPRLSAGCVEGDGAASWG
jgi:hypothetical protein